MLTINSGHLAAKPRRAQPAVRVHTANAPSGKPVVLGRIKLVTRKPNVMFAATAPNTKPVADLRFQLVMSSSSRPCTPADYLNGHAATRDIRQEMHKSWKGNRGSFRA